MILSNWLRAGANNMGHFVTLTDTRQRIEQLLQQALAPTQLQVVDESAQHAGHAAVLRNPGAGHFYVCIASAQFVGKTVVQCHQMVYRALGELMQQHIHALRIDTHLPKADD